MRFASCLLVALTTGCGLLIDVSDPDDAAIPPQGMDAGAADAGFDAGRDAGPPAECEVDEDCDDDLFCNGAERCVRGTCRDGRPVDCGDDVACTVDACDEGEDVCEHDAEPDRCPIPEVVCLGAACDPVLGCVVTTDDEACDDGIDCTLDRCSEETGCEHVPSDSECELGEYCDVTSADTPGCRRIPDFCLTDSECPTLRCNGPPRCDASTGRCVYAPVMNDVTCSGMDPCLPSFCMDGACVTLPRVTCDVMVRPDSCTVERCERNARGDTVTCVDAPRPGACEPSMPCHSGTCSGSTCVETALCVPSDACHLSTCAVGGGCAEVPVACGTNSTCVPGAMGPSCECDDGWTRCSMGAVGCECPVPMDAGTDAGHDAGTDAGRDAGPYPDAGRDAGLVAFDAGAACLPGRLDCDLDLSCECDSEVSRCVGNRCACRETCRAGETCCRVGDYGFCAPSGDCPDGVDTP